MMKLRNNVKITTPRSAQTQLRAMFGALEATLQSPDNDTDVIVGGAGTVGFVYVPDADALTVAQMRVAPWLELAVDDSVRAAEKLDALGLMRLTVAECRDGAHIYFVAPGGLVFRLATHS